MVLVQPRLGAHAAAWDELVRQAPLPTPFLESWWLEAVADGTTKVLLVLDGDRLVGGLPLTADRWLGMRRFGFPGARRMAPDHVDALAAPGYEDPVARALAGWFRAQGAYLLDVKGVPAHSLLRRSLPAPAAGAPFSSAPFVSLAGNGPAGPQSSRARNTVRRTRARLVREGYEHRRVDGAPEAFDRAWDDLVRLHRERWSEETNFLRSLPVLAPVARAGAALGQVAIHELVADGQVIASMLVMDVADRRCYYQSGRAMAHRWRGAGAVLMAEVADDARRRGLRELDLLRGREPYKLEWTDRERPLLRLRAARGLPVLVLVPLAVADRLKPVVARTVRRLAAAMRRRPRPG